MTSLPPDPYKILGVPKDAQIPEIRSAHRKLVLKCHPDKVQDPTLKAQKQDEFQKVQQAYELLSDEKERARYDDQVKLAELRRQMQAKANVSVPRASPKYSGDYDVRNVEPRSTTYKSAQSPSSSKTYTYSSSWEEDYGHGPRVFEAHIRTKPRESSSYPEKSSRRESEREREARDREFRDREARDREARDREKDRDRRRKLEEEMAYARKSAEKAAEKIAKEQRRAEKKQREKQRDKDIKREREETRRSGKPYIETYEEDVIPRSEKKKSSSKKHDEKRERSSHREDIPPMAPPPLPQDRSSWGEKEQFAASYIQLARSKSSTVGQSRQTTYVRNVQPPAPTPPPAPGQTSVFAIPDEDIRRSQAAKAVRRGSSDTIKSTREKAYKKASNERLDEPMVFESSPPTRHVPQFQKSSSQTPVMSSSPPRQLPRQNTMPVESNYVRTVPPIPRSKTFSAAEATPRGRSRSRLQSQIEEESEEESEEDYDRRERDRRSHRTRRTRSPEASRYPEEAYHAHVNDSRGKTHGASYSRHIEAEPESYNYYVEKSRVVDARPSMAPRDSSFRTKYYKVKESPAYGVEDVAYSAHYPQTQYRGEEYSAYA